MLLSAIASGHKYHLFTPAAKQGSLVTLTLLTIPLPLLLARAAMMCDESLCNSPSVYAALPQTSGAGRYDCWAKGSYPIEGTGLELKERCLFKGVPSKP